MAIMTIGIGLAKNVFAGHGVDENGRAARSHWGIENSPHWVLDVTFREDDYRARNDHAPHNFAALRKFALALLHQDTQFPQAQPAFPSQSR